MAGVRGACQVLDALLASRAPAFAGKVRGQEQGGQVGEGLGDMCELQDLMLHGFMALGNKVGMWWPWPCLGCSRIRVRSWGSLSLSKRCRESRDRSWTRGDSQGNKLGGCHCL